MPPNLPRRQWKSRNNMAEITAQLNSYRQSPRKVRVVANAIKGKSVKEAKSRLDFITKRATGPLHKLLNSAIANAKQNASMDENILYVKKVFVDQGPSLKRWRARAQGRAASIKKRMSHITVILGGG